MAELRDGILCIAEKHTEREDIVFRETSVYFTQTNAGSYRATLEGMLPMDKFMQEVELYLGKNFELSETEMEECLQRMYRAIFGLHVLEPLIWDRDISDIRINDWNNVRVSRSGKRMGTDVTFFGKTDLELFVQRLAYRNKVDLGRQPNDRTQPEGDGGRGSDIENETWENQMKYTRDFKMMTKPEQKDFIAMVIRRYNPYIKKGLFVCRKTRENSFYNSEDAYQDLILRVIRSIRNYDLGKGDFDTYIRANIYLDAAKCESEHTNASRNRRLHSGGKGKPLEFTEIQTLEERNGENPVEAEVLYLPLLIEEELTRKNYRRELPRVLDFIAQGYSPADAQKLTAKETGIPFSDIYREYWRFTMNCRNRRRREEKLSMAG